MRIILIRHALAEPFSAKKNDAERELLPRGRKRSLLLAQGLKNVLKDFDKNKIISSPWKRAIQTAEILKDALKIQELIISEEVCSMDANNIWLNIKKKLSDNVIIVGHEPFLSTWVYSICSQKIYFKKAAICQLEIKDYENLKGIVLCYLHPKLIEALA